MNFLRRVVHYNSSEDDEAAAAAAARMEALCRTITIPDLDQAIAQLQDRLEAAHEITLSGYLKHRREQDERQRAYDQANQRLYNRLDRVVATAHLTPYMIATKRVRDYIVPGAVAALQAQLCLHLHAMCIHNEQIRQLQQSCSQVMWWYEDMQKQLQQDQATHELALMNQVVQAKMRVGRLVDQKNLRERDEERQQQQQQQQQSNRSDNNNNIRRTFSRSISRQQQRGSMVIQRTMSKEEGIGRMPRRSVLNSSTRGNRIIMSASRRTISPRIESDTSKNIAVDNETTDDAGRVAIVLGNTGNRQRVVRKMSRRGTAVMRTTTAGGSLWTSLKMLEELQEDAH